MNFVENMIKPNLMRLVLILMLNRPDFAHLNQLTVGF